MHLAVSQHTSKNNSRNSENVRIHVFLCVLFPAPVCLGGVFGFLGACINKGLLYILTD